MKEKKDIAAILFGKRKLRYTIDGEKKRAVVYSVSENIFNDSVNREVIILRTVYDLTDRFARYRDRLRHLLALMLISFAMLALMLYTFRKIFTQRLDAMVEALTHDRDLNTAGFLIKELKMVAEAINHYRNKLKRRTKELEILSSTDPLTNVYNRRHFEQMLDLCIYEFQRYRRSFALIIFDIDNFKEINDHYGHDIGDAILRELAEVVRHEIRRTDLLFRTGGEEFAILLAPVEGEEAHKIAEGLRRSVEMHRFLGRYKVTISVGVSVFLEGDDKATLYRRVDTFMYGSKERGKNRVTSDLEFEEASGEQGSRPTP
jgi:diguanylate cyclase (GGDEF)-like protein